MQVVKLKKIRELVANYMGTEGCPCCEGKDHEKNESILAEALQVEKYEDGSGYNFAKYRSNTDG